MLNYFQAQNIRSKILNPLFVGLYFYNSVQLLVNKQLFSDNEAKDFKEKGIIIEIDSSVSNPNMTNLCPFILVQKDKFIKTFENIADKSIKLRCLLAQKFWAAKIEECPSDFYEIPSNVSETMGATCQFSEDIFKCLVTNYQKYIEKRKVIIEKEIVQVGPSSYDQDCQENYEENESEEDNNNMIVENPEPPTRTLTNSGQNNNQMDIECSTMINLSTFDSNPVFVFNPNEQSSSTFVTNFRLCKSTRTNNCGKSHRRTRNDEDSSPL